MSGRRLRNIQAAWRSFAEPGSTGIIGLSRLVERDLGIKRTCHACALDESAPSFVTAVLTGDFFPAW